MTHTYYKTLIDDIEGGKYWHSWMHKTSTPTPGAAGRWADMSMGAGVPKYNAYVGDQYAFTPLVNTNNSAIYCGPTPPDANHDKHLWRMGIQCATSTQNVPLTCVLCDYLGFYPLIDGDSTDQQNMDNTQTLPRYTDGTGVRMFLVTTSPMTANADVTISYTNQDGTAGRTSSGSVSFSGNLGVVVSCIAQTAAATKIGPWLPLANGDQGVRSVESVTFSTASGGFMALVLAKPLTSILIREASTWTEKELCRTQGHPPQIYDGAFLNMLFQNSGTGNPGVTRGEFMFICHSKQ